MRKYHSTVQQRSQDVPSFVPSAKQAGDNEALQLQTSMQALGECLFLPGDIDTDSTEFALLASL